MLSLLSLSLLLLLLLRTVSRTMKKPGWSTAVFLVVAVVARGMVAVAAAKTVLDVGKMREQLDGSFDDALNNHLDRVLKVADEESDEASSDKADDGILRLLFDDDDDHGDKSDNERFAEIVKKSFRDPSHGDHAQKRRKRRIDHDRLEHERLDGLREKHGKTVVSRKVSKSQQEINMWRDLGIRKTSTPPHQSELPGDYDLTPTPEDVLGAAFNASSLLRPPGFRKEIPYLGVLLDAGRHYFPLDWIKRMIHVISIMDFNYLHFRLTDDQTFNVRLESQPLLAYPTTLNNNTKVYDPEELRDIVTYARSKGVVVVPEINVPGHAASWAGIPDLIVRCPQFICEKGYGVPLNVSSPKLRPVLKDILAEIIDIFDDPPFLHLGGDEVNMARPCFDEIGQEIFDYNDFEGVLKTILSEIRYDESRVIRWEMSDVLQDLDRAGKITHFWLRKPGSHDWCRHYDAKQYDTPLFLSSDLYFDTNEEDSAFEVYVKTKRLKHNEHPKSPVLGIVGGTFELSTDFWVDRNVVGRLLAVSLGASEMETTNRKDFFRTYRKVCETLGLPPSVCNLYGVPPRRYRPFRNELKDRPDSVWKSWIKATCERLTYSEQTLVYQSVGKGRDSSARSKRDFWRTISKPTTWDVLDVTSDAAKTKNEKHALSSLRGAARLVNYSGVIMDLSETPWFEGKDDTLIVDGTMAPLGLNMLQLRLVTDKAFAYQPDGAYRRLPLPNIVTSKLHGAYYPTLKELKEMKSAAAEYGVAILPEIAISTNAGGWDASTFNAPCPKFVCEHGRHMPMQLDNGDYPPLLYNVIGQLVDDVASTPFIHLGHDERQRSAPCYEEAYGKEGAEVAKDFDVFEETILRMLRIRNITSDRVIRWENSERTRYPSRFGAITQCAAEEPCRSKKKNSDSDNGSGSDDPDPWIGTVDVRRGGPYRIYSATRDLASHGPIGIVSDVGGMYREEDPRYHENRIGQRLLAFSIGTLDRPVMDRSEFEAFYTWLCRRAFEGIGHQNRQPTNKTPLGVVEMDCAGFAATDEDAPELIRNTEETTFADFRNKTCRSRTRYQAINHMLPGDQIETIDSLQTKKQQRRRAAISP